MHKAPNSGTNHCSCKRSHWYCHGLMVQWAIFVLSLATLLEKVWTTQVNVMVPNLSRVHVIMHSQNKVCSWWSSVPIQLAWTNNDMEQGGHGLEDVSTHASATSKLRWHKGHMQQEVGPKHTQTKHICLLGKLTMSAGLSSCVSCDINILCPTFCKR